jgi:Ca-activated chloride channel family protein
MHIQADRALIPAHTPSVRHLTIKVTAPTKKGSAHERPPVSVGLVLDRSGSMDGQKIEMARAAVAHAIKLLNERDRLAVVVYDDRVETILECTPASAEAKKKALDRLARIEARGATNLSGGWLDVLGALRAPGGPGAGVAVSRVLLLTDGLANQGIVDPTELAEIAGKSRAQGIATSTFGVGADFDEELLSKIATEGGGHFYFIEKPKQIPDFLTSELGETLEIVARDVVLDITCSTGVDAMMLNGFAVDTAPGRVRVKLGDLVADQEITIAVAVSCGAHLLETTAFVDCRVTDRDGALHPEPIRVEWRAADAAETERQPINYAVLVTVAEILAERARVTALAANRRGQFEEARRVIRDIIQHLLGLAPGNRQIIAIVDALRRDELELGQAMDAMELKSRHYASYVAERSRDTAGKARRRRNA